MQILKEVYLLKNSSRWKPQGSGRHLRAGLGARHEVLLPSARQAILTAGPWVSHPWFEQFLRAVTPLRDQRFHKCSGDHAIG